MLYWPVRTGSLLPFPLPSCVKACDYDVGIGFGTTMQRR